MQQSVNMASNPKRSCRRRLSGICTTLEPLKDKDMVLCMVTPVVSAGFPSWSGLGESDIAPSTIF